VTNVARHAQAKHCTIALAVETGAGKGNGRLHLAIQDDGIGLPDRVTAGVGLHSMRERAEELGGAIAIQSLTSGGTRVAAVLPLTGE
jgi:signal transduction histidine kinase